MTAATVLGSSDFEVAFYRDRPPCAHELRSPPLTLADGLWVDSSDLTADETVDDVIARWPETFVD